MLVMDLVMGGDPMGGILGIIVGHLFYFVREEWPGGKRWVTAPQALYNIPE